MSDLRDIMPFEYHITLDEGQGDNKWLEVEGVFQRADAKNANGRIYPRSVLEAQIKSPRITEALNKRAMLGELDHPSDGKSSLLRIAHIVTGLRIEENGDVIGKALILNNPEGERLKELFRAGALVGISSRGSGSVKPVNGAQVVQEDYQLNTFDFVVTPSTFGAYPKPTEESTVKTEGTEADDNYDVSYGAPDPNLTKAPKPEPDHNPSPVKAESNAAEVHNSLAGVPKVSHGTAVGAEGHPSGKDTPVTEKCPFGIYGCGKPTNECHCLESLDYEDEYESFEDEIMTSNMIESVVQRTRVQERIAEADRNAAGRMISALISKIRELSSQASVVQTESADTSTFEGEIEQLREALSVAQNEASQLRATLDKVRSKVESVENNINEDEGKVAQIVSYVESVIRKDADAADWKDYLLESKSLSQVDERHAHMKKLIVSPRIEGLPTTAAPVKLTESASVPSTNVGVHLFRRAAKSMGRSSRGTDYKSNGIR